MQFAIVRDVGSNETGSSVGPDHKGHSVLEGICVYPAGIDEHFKHFKLVSDMNIFTIQIITLTTID